MQISQRSILWLPLITLLHLVTLPWLSEAPCLTYKGAEDVRELKLCLASM